MSASHGNTPAAWTAVSIMFVGFLISGLALPLELPWLFFAGLVVVALGAVAGKVMSIDGHGQRCHLQGRPRPRVRQRHHRALTGRAPAGRSRRRPVRFATVRLHTDEGTAS